MASAKRKVIVIGSGSNRIGQGIEFDYNCVHAASAIKDLGYECIMLNCNPETVSTYYTISSKLYFSPLVEEEIINILNAENAIGDVLGIILQFGGQTAINLSYFLEQQGYNILGVNSSIIDLVEDRNRFSEFIKQNECKQSEYEICYALEQALKFSEKAGYPIIIRPSYVIGGTNIKIIENEQQLIDLSKQLNMGIGILVEKFLQNAIELEVDVLSDGKEIYIPAIMEQLERTGIHSGDSSCIIPTFSINDSMINELLRISKKLTRALNVKGLINIQFALYSEELYVIEINPRASRTIPFVSKAVGVDLAYIATQVVLGKTFSQFNLPDKLPDNIYYLKKPIFSFDRFLHVNTKLGPEMKSTGELMVTGRSWNELAIKSMSFKDKQVISSASEVIVISQSGIKEQFNQTIKEVANIVNVVHKFELITSEIPDDNLKEIEELIKNYNIRIIVLNTNFYISNSAYYDMIKKYSLLEFNSPLEHKALIKLLMEDIPKVQTYRALQEVHVRNS